MNLSDTGPLVEARELLLDALANYDAGVVPAPRWVGPEDGPWPPFHLKEITRAALLDVCVMHDLWAVWDYDEHNPGWRRDTIGLDDFVAAHEYAVELISEWLDTGQRPTARPL